MKVLFVVYDNGSQTSWFPLGLGYLAASIFGDHDIDVFDMAIHHWPADRLTRYIELHKPDIVAVGAIGGYWQYQQLLAISMAVNACQNRKEFLYVLGGHGPSPDPEFFTFKTGCDVVCIGEADRTFPELVNTYEAKENLLSVPGVFCDGKYSAPREPIGNIDALPYPLWRAFDWTTYRLLRLPNCEPTDLVMPVLSGRGCPFHCTFCYRMMPGYRMRYPSCLKEEIVALQRVYGITYIAFADELLMYGTDRTLQLCEMIQPLSVKWSCNGRLNYATPDVLDAMRDAGCVFINYGIEALDDNVLNQMRKSLTVEQIYKGVENTIAAGISPGLNIIWGNIGDSPRTLAKAVDFLCRYSDTSQMRTIRPVTPYPGTELYAYAEERGLIEDTADFYEKHTNSDTFTVQFMNLNTEDAHACLSLANDVLVRHHHTQVADRTIDAARRLYANPSTPFRGFRQT